MKLNEPWNRLNFDADGFFFSNDFRLMYAIFYCDKHFFKFYCFRPNYVSFEIHKAFEKNVDFRQITYI